jgi:hypothetical protein
VPQASILLTDSTSMSRRPPAFNKPVQQPLAVNRFFSGRGLKLAGMGTFGNERYALSASASAALARLRR